VAEGAELIAQAREVAHRAYAPYSNFRVGAAVRSGDGSTFVGCNVESASYGLTVCAERIAIFNAIAAGAQRPFSEIALTCLDAGEPGGCMPCGACRQVIVEHLVPDGTLFIDGAGQYTVQDLLPFAFTLRPF
jgi:cytidine deaminase